VRPFFCSSLISCFPGIIIIIITVIIIVIQFFNGSLLGDVSDWLLLNCARALISWTREEKILVAWYIENFCDGKSFTWQMLSLGVRGNFLSIFLQKIWARICEETNIWDLVKRDPYVLRFGLFPPLNGGRGFSPSSRQAVRDETYRSKLLQISRAWGVQFLLPLIFTTACKVGITWARPLILCHTKGWVVPPGILHQFVSHLSQTEQTEHGGSFYA